MSEEYNSFRITLEMPFEPTMQFQCMAMSIWVEEAIAIGCVFPQHYFSLQHFCCYTELIYFLRLPSKIRRRQAEFSILPFWYKGIFLKTPVIWKRLRCSVFCCEILPSWSSNTFAKQVFLGSSTLAVHYYLFKISRWSWAYWPRSCSRKLTWISWKYLVHIQILRAQIISQYFAVSVYVFFTLRVLQFWPLELTLLTGIYIPEALLLAKAVTAPS